MDKEIIPPTKIYDLLEADERSYVDEYINYIVKEQRRKKERIIHALSLPIPTEYLRKSKGKLYKPLLLAAVSEKIKDIANEQDFGPEAVIKEYLAIAFAKQDDFLEPAGFGDLKMKNLNEIDPNKMGAIKSVEIKPGPFGLHTKLVLQDKNPALTKLTEFFGMKPREGKPAILEEWSKPLEAKEREKELTGSEGYIKLLEQIG